MLMLKIRWAKDDLLMVGLLLGGFCDKDNNQPSFQEATFPTIVSIVSVNGKTHDPKHTFS